MSMHINKRGGAREFPLRSCGKRHNLCKKCNPESAKKLGSNTYLHKEGCKCSWHKRGTGFKAGTAHSKWVPVDEYFIFKIRNNKTTKRKLILTALKEEKCEICKLPPIWEGKFLALQLDHIDGNWKNNRLENLRLLCPNCHTQTETWGTKKRPAIV